MKILLLADSDSPHILRWAKAIRNSGCTVGIFSLHIPNLDLYLEAADISLFSINASRELQTKRENNISKIIYLKAVRKVKKIIKQFKPDILHSHYASSYGLIGAMSGFHPYIISVWGGDIYSFPNYSTLHYLIAKYNLSKADRILSTSRVMKAEIKKYTNKQIIVTPFGIDVERFYPKKVNSLFKDDDIVIGTVKTLEKKYGVEYLIRAFSIVKKKFPEKPLKLLVIGKGTQEKYLKTLTKKLNIENDTVFTGYINHDNVQNYHNMLDISVSISIEDSESFGVAVLEASACEKPVVVSRVGGLPEVVKDNATGYVVEKKNIHETANALAKLIMNKNLREEMGKAGRQRVIKYFNWEDNVIQMIKIYKQLL